MNTNDIIKQKLNSLEQKEGFKIIYACESGSRAWGFSSPDSDYDVRFIYVRDILDYLRIVTVKDTCNFELNDIYDINGWDLKKMLGLLLKSNPVIFEWAMSPIVYVDTPEWSKIRTTLADYLSPRALGWHYYNITKGVLDTHFKEQDVVLKKYFYVIRPILAANYVLENEGLPPMEFEALAKDYLPSELKDDIDKLLVMKRSTSEKIIGKRIDKIDKWINSEMEHIQSKLVQLPKTPPKSDESLTELFYNILT